MKRITKVVVTHEDGSRTVYEGKGMIQEVTPARPGEPRFIQLSLVVQE